MSLYAETNKLTWPFVIIPGFEHYGHNMLIQSQAEVFTFFPIVKEEEREAYLDFANSNVKGWVEEGHLIQKGSFERLLDPHGNMTYHPYFTALTPTGIIEMPYAQEYYTPCSQWSPPPATYGLVNWNAMSHPDFQYMEIAAKKLRKDLLFTQVSSLAGLLYREILSCLVCVLRVCFQLTKLLFRSFSWLLGSPIR